jgi:membrane protease YdiL (CAAX protease family)
MGAAALGFAAPRPVLTLGISVGLVSLVLANQLVSLQQVGAARPEELHSKVAQVALRIFPQDTAEKLVFFGVVATVATCEEIIFRGFVQGLFTDLSGFAVVGVLISAALFSWAHLYQGKRGLIATFVVGVLFSAARAWSGSLIPCVAAHFVIDLMAGYMFPGRLRSALEGSSGLQSVEAHNSVKNS